MKEHHEAWLEKHPGKDEFLEQALNNGFDIHHVNGDHYDNRHENLVLIYSGDHSKLHNLCMPERPALETMCLNKGERCYKSRLTGITWQEVTAIHGPYALLCAKNYAKKNKLEWPISIKRAKAQVKVDKKKEQIKAETIAYIESIDQEKKIKFNFQKPESPRYPGVVS